MKRLIRNKSITATEAINNSEDNRCEYVSIEKLIELLPQVKQLRNHNVAITATNDDNIILTVDNISYETV